ncbi:phosphoribosylamine--glycine ligase [candidate division WOR-3 bacterium]|nr:phosphoribosylamine--glycine ligase [candidate division WOR-3 bacterium]
MKGKKAAVIGSGAREHAIAKALSKDRDVSEIYCLPGNPGTEEFCVNIQCDIKKTREITSALASVKPHLVVIGPEDPLAEGVADDLRRKEYTVFGPGKKGAELESDKSFAKKAMNEAGIPTPKWFRVNSMDNLEKSLDEMNPPYVVKASGLAQGKGVYICKDRKEALSVGKEMLAGDILRGAGKKIVLEEFIQGFEVSFFFATDGKYFFHFPPAHDYKKAYDGDTGPNTGGMGSFSWAGSCFLNEAGKKIAEPLLEYMKSQKIDYRGVIFAGAIISEGKMSVLEFNCRFGDPETQSSLTLVEEGFYNLLYSCARGNAENSLSFSPEKAVSVVIASQGYPEKPVTGVPITLDEKICGKDISLYYAGVDKNDNGLFTAGGRVFTLTGTAPTLSEAKKLSYGAISKIKFKGSWYRKDIAGDVEGDLF